MLDLALLFGAEVIFTFAFPRSGARIASHDAAQRFDFSDDVGQAKMFDLFADLGSGFVSYRTFGEIGFAVKPTDVETLGGFSNCTVYFIGIEVAVGFTEVFERGGAALIAAREFE